MKHKIIVLCSVVIAVALGVVSVQAYNRHQVGVRADQGTQAIVAQQAQKEYDLKQAHLQSDLQKLTIQCQNFTVAYDLIPVAQRAKVPKPDCVLLP